MMEPDCLLVNPWDIRWSQDELENLMLDIESEISSLEDFGPHELGFDPLTEMDLQKAELEIEMMREKLQDHLEMTDEILVQVANFSQMFPPSIRYENRFN